MERFRSGASLSPINQAEAYWTALCAGGEVPRRSQIDPRGLENILEYACVLERIAPGIARFRLAGQHLTALAGMEVRGMPLTAFFTPATRAHLSAALEHVFDVPAVAELTLTAEPRAGRVPGGARMILLPLRSDLGAIDRALGVLVAEGMAGQIPPRRFHLSTAALRDITDPSAPPAPAAISAAAPAVTGFAEAQTVLSGRAPHLRLVVNDE